MTSLGFLTIKKQQEGVYFTSIAKEAPSSLTLYRFTPLDIEPLTEMVNGYVYNRELEKWEKSKFPIPEFIYDRCFYGSTEASKKCEPIVRWLKKRPGTTFLGYGLPNKWDVYEALSADREAAPYLPTTCKIETYKDLKKAFKQSNSIIIKPISGSQGNGVIKLHMHTTGIELQYQVKDQIASKTFTSALDFKEYMKELLRENTYISQPFFTLLLDSCPYDVRILMQKNEHGEWIEQGRGIRKGRENGIVSNLYHGGDILPFPAAVNAWQPSKRKLILEEIESILEYIPSRLEEKFGRIFELGLDIGVTDDGAVWLLDINSKPGRKVINQTFPDKKEEISQAPIKYCEFLKQVEVK
ncbi:YheC/YheD family protein [Bacillus salitolerans]|uniref:YheC/YheD family protein n=1 Tax=Bacillus salitolerans TaxID=1437434 RepID=A0ABW4LY27_9BACI